MATPIKDRVARSRARKRGDLPPVKSCPACGARVLGNLSDLCRKCWRKTEAGREWERLYQRHRRGRLSEEEFQEHLARRKQERQQADINDSLA